MKVTPVKRAFNQHKMGTVFELPDKSAAVLIKVGLVREPTAEELAPQTTRRRYYRRRDMQAGA